ncbi:MAG: hypothetical protein JHC93_08525, partial [Parachlamydiales bacterium]|nr:hypothetical protein [Parachlamydiales bacterium]
MTMRPTSSHIQDYDKTLSYIESTQESKDQDFNKNIIGKTLKKEFGLDIKKLKFRKIVEIDGEKLNYWYPVDKSEVELIKGSDKEELISRAKFLLGISQVYDNVLAATEEQSNQGGELTFYENRKTEFTNLSNANIPLKINKDEWAGKVQDVFFQTIGFENPKVESKIDASQEAVRSELDVKSTTTDPTDSSPTGPIEPDMTISQPIVSTAKLFKEEVKQAPSSDVKSIESKSENITMDVTGKTIPLSDVQKYWENLAETSTDFKPLYQKRADNVGDVIKYCDVTKTNLSYRKVSGDGNCGISSFLISLLSKISKKEFLKYLNHANVIKTSALINQTTLNNYKGITKQAIEAFNLYDEVIGLDKRSILLLSKWLRYRILIEFLIYIPDSKKHPRDGLDNVNATMQEFVNRNLTKSPIFSENNLFADFSRVIIDLKNPVNIAHLLVLGDIFKRPVIVFNLDGGPNQLIQGKKSPTGQNLYLVNTGMDAQSAHFDSLSYDKDIIIKDTKPSLVIPEKAPIPVKKTVPSQKKVRFQVSSEPLSNASKISSENSISTKPNTSSFILESNNPISLEKEQSNWNEKSERSVSSEEKDLYVKRAKKFQVIIDLSKTFGMDRNLSFQKTEDNMNSAENSFLMALINKLNPEDFLKELKFYENLKIENVHLQSYLKSFSDISLMTKNSYETIKT